MRFAPNYVPVLAVLLLASRSSATPLPSLQVRQGASDSGSSPPPEGIPDQDTNTAEDTIPEVSTVPSGEDDLFSTSSTPTREFAPLLQNIYLVTSTSSICVSNSSLLPNVSALSLFAPMHTPQPLLRQIAAGYNSLPTFNLTSGGTLTTWSDDGFGRGEYLYGNQAVVADESLTFARGANVYGGGGVGLNSYGNITDSCLLQVSSSMDGWAVCPGPLGETVVTYRGAEEGCKQVFLHAVEEPPY